MAGSNTRAYYQAAFTFTNIIGYSASLAFALYPKLLAKSCPEEQVGLSFKTVLMLAIPLSTITMAMATSFLTILNIDYAVAWPVVIALTVDSLVVLVSQFYSSILMGAEAFDAEGKISLRQLVKSKIFKVFTVPLHSSSHRFALDILRSHGFCSCRFCTGCRVRDSDYYWRSPFNLHRLVLVHARLHPFARCLEKHSQICS